ncbi:MAG: multicopper oxidase domain-containing protein [Acidobacteria bacterium]|nr:multicopper oxidase domain-containing protein [Acidobacteriota bacterium]
MINRQMIRKFSEVIMVALIVLLAGASGHALGATYNLRAAQTTIPMPDGTSIIMWGYALVSYDIGSGPVDGDNVITVPGPRLMVPAGQGLTVNLTNELPEAVSIIIPGQASNSAQITRNPDGRIRSFTHETPITPPGEIPVPVPYTWSNLKPGTYLYHSGTHPAVQVQMGLYGGVTKNAVDANGGAAQAYPGMTYDEGVVILYSEIDPALHEAVAGPTPIYGTAGYPSTIDYNPKYFLVNGVAADAAEPVAVVDAGTTVLLRFLNAGLTDHAAQILGTHLSVVAEDGNPYPYPRQHHSLLLAAGKTLDAWFSASDGGKDYPIFDRRAYRTNITAVQGTMYTYISVQQAVP